MTVMLYILFFVSAVVTLVSFGCALLNGVDASITYKELRKGDSPRLNQWYRHQLFSELRRFGIACLVLSVSLTASVVSFLRFDALNAEAAVAAKEEAHAKREADAAGFAAAGVSCFAMQVDSIDTAEVNKVIATVCSYGYRVSGIAIRHGCANCTVVVFEKKEGHVGE